MTYVRCGFAFVVHRFSASIVIWRLLQCLIHTHGIPHSTASDLGTHFTGTKLWEKTSNYGVHCLWHIAHHLEAADLENAGKAFYKCILNCQFEGNAMNGWGVVL